MSKDKAKIGLAREEYVIEKYNGDIQEPEFLVERLVFVNDELVEHWVKEETE